MKGGSPCSRRAATGPQIPYTAGRGCSCIEGPSDGGTKRGRPLIRANSNGCRRCEVPTYRRHLVQDLKRDTSVPTHSFASGGEIGQSLFGPVALESDRP